MKEEIKRVLNDKTSPSFTIEEIINLLDLISFIFPPFLIPSDLLATKNPSKKHKFKAFSHSFYAFYLPFWF